MYIFGIQHKIIAFFRFEVKIGNGDHVVIFGYVRSIQLREGRSAETGSIGGPHIQVPPSVTQSNIGSCIVFKKFVVHIPEADYCL